MTIPAALLTDLDARFSDYLATGRAPGAAWGVFDRSGLVHAGGDGRSRAYRIASCTKSFTAAAVLALRDEGALSLDDPITRWVPAFASVPLPTATSTPPTVAQLLTMSGGLATDNPWGDRQESITDDELDALVSAGLGFDTVPGTAFAYSNLGYALLGRVVQEAAGAPFRSVIRRRFLDPLGLVHTAWDSDVDAPGGVAPGLHARDGEWQELPFSGPGAFSAIGGLFSTVEDLAHWAGWLASAFDPQLPAIGGPLSAASRRELQQIHRFDGVRGYGYGLAVDVHPEHGPLVAHSGGYPGFSARMRWSAEQGVGVVAFANGTYANVGEPADAALVALLDGLPRRDRLAELWPATRAAQATVTDLIRSWSEAEAEALLAMNVAMDEPLDRRRAQIERAIAAIGGVREAPAFAERSVAPSHLEWRLSGVTGSLKVVIELTPQADARVQTLRVTVA